MAQSMLQFRIGVYKPNSKAIHPQIVQTKSHACSIRHQIRVKAESGDQGVTTSLYQQREQSIKNQLDELKRKSLEAQTEVLAHAKSLSKTAGILPSAEGDSTASLRARIDEAVRVMSSGLIERDVEVRLLLLAALSGEHLLLIGPPGTAKSELGRRLSKLCKGKYFERLLTKFSVPEELFGPLSMRALEEDKYVRQTENYLPDADVAFVDEIFKANSAILNTLLTVLNERLFDNGSKRVRVPLLCLVGASNELPESEELDALYDRFLIRRQVSQVSPAGLIEMLGEGRGKRQANNLRSPGAADTASNSSIDEASSLLLDEDFHETRPKAEELVDVPSTVLNLIADLRAYLQDKCEPPVYVSDRRLVKAVSLMQVAAYTNGRSRLTEYDCLILRHVLWQRPEESERIYEWLLNSLASDDGMQQMQYLLSGMFGRACKSLNDAEAVKVLIEEIGQLKATLGDKLAAVYSNASEGFPIVAENIWLGRDEAKAVASALLPKLEKSRDEVEKLLFEVVTLETALTNGAGAVELAQLLPQQWAKFLRQ